MTTATKTSKPSKKTASKRKSTMTDAQKEAYKAKKEEESKALVAEMKAGIAALTSSDDWMNYLAVQAMFHRYSYQNTMLIMLQRPSATRVMGRKQWDTRASRVLNNGEWQNGIKIQAPVFGYYKKTETDANGKEKPVTIKFVRFFKTVQVFDIAQTNGPDLPDVNVIKSLSGQEDKAREIYAQLKAYAEAELSCTVSQESIPRRNGAVVNGYYQRPSNLGGHTIVIERNNEPLQQAKTLAHEIAHRILHSEEDGEICHTPRDFREVEAESSAFVIMRAFGIDTADYSFGYVAVWAHGEGDRVEAVANNIQRAAHQVIEHLETMAEIIRLRAENARLRAEQAA